ncbi:MAG TPA: TIM-barrel domain-containing protein [Terracidiphilus sp.]|nr:TIM-barrel domain-containing protein [Terracidiphilus sp.]
MRTPLLHVAALALLTAGFANLPAQTPGQLLDPVEAPHAALASDPAAPPAPADDPTEPVADPRAVVTLGHARFTVLTPQLIRMEWSADGRFEDHASFVFINRRLPVPRFQHVIADDKSKVTIKTNALTLVYTPGAASISSPSPNPDGRFTSENLVINLEFGDKLAIWRPGMADDQNLLGTTRTLDGAVGDKTREPIEQGLISRAGWALVDDSSRPLFDSADFSFKEGEKSPWPWAIERPPGDRQDWYFFGYGHDYKKALGDYVKVAGRIPLPPRFAFGAWWSRYWAYSDQEIEQIVRGFHENDVPLDVFVIDMDWHINIDQLKARGETDKSGQRLGWTGYTWNKLLFPDPDAFLAKLHADRLKTSLNLHPASGIQPWEDQYAAMARAMGIDPATRQYVPFDITSKKYVTNYFNLVLHPLEKQGIDFWWLDWQQEKTTSMPGVNPTWWLNYVHFTDQQREGNRPLLFHRWGGLGNHRYQIGFSGDTVSVWPSLAFQPWFTATAANVGYAYWSHDIGGHMPGAVDPELFTRWVQFGAFSPILRTHTTKNPASERRIWAYPEPYSNILRDTFQLRYALQPYMYTEARRTYDTGVAFFHPLYYDWPDSPGAYSSKGEYFFGDQVIVAPVVAPADKLTGLAAEDVWLPPGEWIEWPTGKDFAGGTAHKRSFSIDEVPVYLKAGAIIPMQPPMRSTGEKPVDPLIVNVWPMPSGANNTYSVYEDSGVSVEYQRGVYARTPIKASQKDDTLRVEIGPVEGSFPGMMRTRSYELRLPADWPPERITVNGAPVKRAGPTGKGGWSYEGNTLTTIIPVPSFSVESRVIIEVHRAQGSLAHRSNLDGYAGAMARLRGAYDAMQKTDPVSRPPDDLIDAMQSGDRLGYHPERATEELTHFHDTLPKAQAAIEVIGKDFQQRVDDYAIHMNPAQRPANMDTEKQIRIDAMTRARALVAEAIRETGKVPATSMPTDKATTSSDKY